MNWAYQGENGVDNWGKIGYPICDHGKKQSPIDIKTRQCKEIFDTKRLKVFPIGTFDCKVLNTVFLAKAQLATRQKHMELEGEPYELVQFHFHSPTEHVIDGAKEDLELHLVHENMERKGQFAVIGIMFHVDRNAGRRAENPFLNQIFTEIPKKYSNVISGGVNFDGLDLTGPYWRYDGSLTTPPCAECVNWIVMKDIHTMTENQLRRYRKFFAMNTNRPPQPLCGREVLSIEVD